MCFVISINKYLFGHDFLQCNTILIKITSLTFQEINWLNEFKYWKQTSNIFSNSIFLINFSSNSCKTIDLKWFPEFRILSMNFCFVYPGTNYTCSIRRTWTYRFFLKFSILPCLYILTCICVRHVSKSILCRITFVPGLLTYFFFDLYWVHVNIYIYIYSLSSLFLQT